ncbi:MAG: DUF1801 domain-containing protein [Thermomicrobiales bacterium]
MVNRTWSRLMGKIVTIDEYIDTLSAPLRETATRMRPLLDEAFPNATGKMWHGHPVWMRGKHPVAGFKAYTGSVTYMIWRGQEQSDEAVPRDMVSAKLHTIDDIEPLRAANWLRAGEPASVS